MSQSSIVHVALANQKGHENMRITPQCRYDIDTEKNSGLLRPTDTATQTEI
jgi:hypothetical protein